LVDDLGFNAIVIESGVVESRTVDDLVSALDRYQLEYTAKSSEGDYKWGERAAVEAQRVDAWFRRMPLQWKLADGFAWSPEAERVRNRAMEGNLEWILNQLGPRARALVYAAAAHLASTPRHDPDEHEPDGMPFGAYAKAHFGKDYVNILNVVVGGEIKNCPIRASKPQVLMPPPTSSIEAPHPYACLGTC
jgi:erythromycin esterase-like protein